MKMKNNNRRATTKVLPTLALVKGPPDEKQLQEARRVMKMALVNPSDQQVWFALQSLRRKKVISDELPSLGRIDEEVVSLGFSALGIKTVSKALRRLEEKGYFKRIVVFAAA
jgi:hypothetical protein